MASVGIVVPAYRPDAERLVEFVGALDERVAPDVIRIELDAPEPGVAERLADLPATVNTAERRRGKGAAITAGFEALDTAVLAFADADGSTPADSVADVIAPVRDGDADLAVGSRRHPRAEVRSHQTLARRRLGDAFAWLARRFVAVGLYDYQCGAKALTRRTWERVRRHLYEPGFAWDVELVAVAAALDCRIAEVPVVWEDHPESTVTVADAVPELLAAVLAAPLRSWRLRGRPLPGVLDRGAREPALVDRLASDE
ncbi:MAG: glycosyltransferase [Halobacteriaceae archaeon]